MATLKPNSVKQQAAASTRSPSQKAAILPRMERLTPSEVESLMSDMQQSLKRMRELRKQKAA